MNININKFIENNTHIDKDEKAIVKFGIDMMISTIMAFITAIIISAVLGMLKEGIIFLISIISIFIAVIFLTVQRYGKGSIPPNSIGIKLQKTL